MISPRGMVIVTRLVASSVLAGMLLARNMLGGDRDLRKIKRPYCGEEIPLRVEDGTNNTA
jgi:hypothetical protein